MIKPEQITDEVAGLADKAYYDIAGDNPTMSDWDIMKHAIAAAINGWQGSFGTMTRIDRNDTNVIILPLLQENNDDSL